MPAHDEARGIAAQLDTLASFVSEYGPRAGVQFTLLVVDDGSADATRGCVEAAAARLAERGVTVRCLSLVRNFGHQAAVIAGLLEAAPSADFVVTLDADGEHPHELLPALIDAWRRGAPIVHTVRRPHRGLGLFKRSASAAYYGLVASLSRVRIRPGMADFKLWDGALLREVSGFLPACGSTRVFAAWLAPGAPAIEYEQRLASGRSSRFTFSKNLSLALDGVVRYSDLPLRFALFMSMFAVLVGIVESIYVVWASLTNRVVPGWSSMIIIVAFFGALQGFSIGVLGEYLLRIQFRKSMPPFVTRPTRRQEQPAAAPPEHR